MAHDQVLIYPDRRTAGQGLATQLGDYAGRTDTIVLALPRGGVPVAAEVAKALAAPLDVLNVRKLGMPWQPEFAAGAIAPGGVLVLNPAAGSATSSLETLLEPVIESERRELARRERVYRCGRPPLDLRDRIAILVDDGIATGATMEAAAMAARAMGAKEVVVAVPVAPPETVRRIGAHADRVVCPEQPAGFMAVGQFYLEFPQLSDAEVLDQLGANR
ncbi:MAG TPA: phosphoribosyltransferase family protein [Steroidobacteraceae bacterium]|nr:phosphoribosyltransferase family protein [Steroidobacteraceae bacterium]